jgi:mannosyltransferase OCH1-like enzyme
MTIPKIIHQTWKDENIPAIWEEGPKSIKRLNPDWSYILWTDKMCRNLIEDHYTWFLDIYDNYPNNIQRADAWRYFALYHIGGVYLDLDFEAVKPFDELFGLCNGELYLTRSSNYDGMTNSIMASTKGCKFWPLLWDKLKERALSTPFIARISRHYLIMYTTGPTLVNDIYNEYTGSLCLLPSRESLDRNACGESRTTGGGKYLRSLPGKSWHKWDSVVVDFIFCNYKMLLVLIGIILGMVVGYFSFRLVKCETGLTSCKNSNIYRPK